MTKNTQRWVARMNLVMTFLGVLGMELVPLKMLCCFRVVLDAFDERVDAALLSFLRLCSAQTALWNHRLSHVWMFYRAYSYGWINSRNANRVGFFFFLLIFCTWLMLHRNVVAAHRFATCTRASFKNINGFMSSHLASLCRLISYRAHWLLASCTGCVLHKRRSRLFMALF